MNKKQKWLIAISTVIFLFVTLNPSVFKIYPSNYPVFKTPYFSTQPMYQYWAVIAVPTAVLFFFFKKIRVKTRRKTDGEFAKYKELKYADWATSQHLLRCLLVGFIPKMQRIVTTTPTRISKEIIQLCKEIDKTQTPFYVSVKPESWAEPKECFQNVKTKVEKDGGHIQFGWSIWEWPKVMIEAEFHAIWISPENTRIDITPKQVNVQRILFLPDKKRVYDYSSAFQRIDNIRRPLSKNPLVHDFIEVSEEIIAFEEKYSPGPAIAFSNEQQQQVWLKLKQTKLELQRQIMGPQQSINVKPGRNKPCPCGSGKKFKRCCGINS